MCSFIFQIAHLQVAVCHGDHIYLYHSAILDCVVHQIEVGLAKGIGFVLHYSVLSEDYKQAWPMIIAVLISVVTTKEIKVMRICFSSTFFCTIY